METSHAGAGSAGPSGAMSRGTAFNRWLPPRWIAAAVLLAHAVLLACNAPLLSPTYDETAYLPAGLSHWTTGNFGLYRAAAPLVRLVAALPVLAAEPQTDWTDVNFAPGGMPEFDVGMKFVHVNGERSFWYFTLARWACIPFSLLGGIVCYRWASELYDPASGALATCLWCVCPNILGHGTLITSDVAGCSLGLLAFYRYWHWLKQPDWLNAIIAGVSLGLVELTKSNWILVFLLWPAMWVAAQIGFRDFRARHPWRLGAVQLPVILLLALYFLNLGYMFDGTGTTLRSYEFASAALQGGTESANRFRGTWLGDIPVPLPKDYVLGVDTLKRNFESNSKMFYLAGEFRDEGWWYYYLYGLAVKVPLGTWLLFGLAVATSLCGRYSASRFDEAVLLTPGIFFFLFTSSQTGLNSHVRYVLVVLPFVFVWIGRLGRSFAQGDRILAGVVVAALAWTSVSSLGVYPHQLSYFNELGGGPLGGHAHLLDSNIDWGQDLLYLKKWLAEHPEASPLGFAYFGNVNPVDVGIDFSLPPAHPVLKRSYGKPLREGPHPGWYAVSVNFLRGYRFRISDEEGHQIWLADPAYAYFQKFRPVARAGYSIYIYHVTPEEANRVRRELGLAELPVANLPSET